MKAALHLTASRPPERLPATTALPTPGTDPHRWLPTRAALDPTDSRPPDTDPQERFR